MVFREFNPIFLNCFKNKQVYFKKNKIEYTGSIVSKIARPELNFHASYSVHCIDRVIILVSYLFRDNLIYISPTRV